MQRFESEAAKEWDVPEIRAKRRVADPDQYRHAPVELGGEYRRVHANGRTTMLSLKAGSAWGCLRDVKPDETVSEEQSRQDELMRGLGSGS